MEVPSNGAIVKLFRLSGSLLTFGMLVPLLMSVACESREAAAAHKAAVEKLAAQKLAEIQKEVATELETSEKAAQARASAAKPLVAKFDIEKDKFSDVVSYNHRNFRNSGNYGISAGIYGSHLFLSTHYHHPDWLVHENLFVKIGEQKQSFSGTPKRDVGGVGGVFERLSLESNDSELLAAFIAYSDPKSEVLVRFSGKGSYDFVLSQKERQGITDTWELYKIMHPKSK